MSAIRLIKMDEKGFEAYMARFLEDYAQGMSRTYEIDIETARESAASQTRERLSQGLDTPGCYIYHIERQTDSGTTCIGYVEFSVPEGEDWAWLDNIDIFEPYQNQGYGTQALALVEQALTEMGIQSMSLHVEADDERALAFYQKRGFKFTGHLMKKAWT